MRMEDLPAGNAPQALAFDHFPTRWQAVLWRNWELVPVATLARLLNTEDATLLRAAEKLGLPVPPDVEPEWMDRGYATLIRANWHLLPYEQLLDLLGWTAERLALHLKEDDFLWTKLGNLKPSCDPVRFRPLTPDETGRTARIRAIVRDAFGDRRPKVRPFDFRKTLEQPAMDAPDTTPSRGDVFEPKFLYSYLMLFGDPLLREDIDPFPDGLLSRYAALGVTGVWLPSPLYLLCPIPGAAPDLSAGWERRRIRLRELARRAKRFGIGIFVYLNEPRGLLESGFHGIESWKGAHEETTGMHALCTSNPEVLRYVKTACADLFRTVPELAGVFTITMSEAITHCHSRWTGHECPRCANRPVSEIVAEVNRAIEEGVHTASPGARVIAWTWAWDAKWAADAIEKLPAGVDLMCVSEWGKELSIGGVPNRVVDYSISQPGPSEESRVLWERAARRGLRTLAKVQLNTSWECSALPYIPVPYLVREHLDNLRTAGVSGLMLSWTLGGYPGGNMDLLRHSPEELATRKFGRVAADVLAAWRHFSDAFREFPFQVEVLYHSPHNVGPANLLYADPTGYAATLVGIPYDDLTRWRGAYPEDVFEAQFEKLSAGWKTGLDVLRAALDRVEESSRTPLLDLDRIARAAYCHFRSACLQVRFVRLRAKADDAARERIRDLLHEEADLARTLAALAGEDSTLGFEATNHYAYTQNDLREKVVQCRLLLDRFAGGEENDK